MKTVTVRESKLGDPRPHGKKTLEKKRDIAGRKSWSNKKGQTKLDDGNAF